MRETRARLNTLWSATGLIAPSMNRLRHLAVGLPLWKVVQGHTRRRTRTMRDYKLQKVLPRLLKEKNMSIKQLCHETGISQPQMSMYINNKCAPNATNLLKISDALQVSTDYLLTGGKERGKGHWIIRGYKMQCNKCLREYPLTAFNYCPYCGDVMGGSQ